MARHPGDEALVLPRDVRVERLIGTGLHVVDDHKRADAFSAQGLNFCDLAIVERVDDVDTQRRARVSGRRGERYCSKRSTNQRSSRCQISSLPT